MKVLLTGATGFIGRHVLRCLRKNGIAFSVLGRHKPTDCKSDEFIQADLLANPDFDALAHQAQATHLLHLAWYAEYGKYWSSPHNFRWVEATLHLVESFCNAGGKHVVVAGTCAEYDWSYGYCQEDVTPANPATLYGVAKDAARRLTMALCAGLDVSCAWGRIFLPYGPGEPSARLIPSLTEVFQGHRAPFGVNSHAYRDFLHVADVAEAFLLLLRSEQSGLFNVSSGQPVQLSEVVNILARHFQADPHPVLELSSQRQNEPPLLVGDNTKLKSLGWHPRISLTAGLTQ